MTMFYGTRDLRCLEEKRMREIANEEIERRAKVDRERLAIAIAQPFSNGWYEPPKS